MHRFSFSQPKTGGRPRTPIRGLPLALAAGLALTASACMSPAAKQSSTAGADRQAAKAQEEGKEQGKPQSWWQRMTRSRESGEKPWVYGDVRPGKGVASDDEHGFTLLRKGEGGSSDPTKPSKVRR
ncbi:MAG: hypothetical protein OXH59_15300 [Rhodospirillaceae bacterium]|nr:hypothetical protein [Rhodospirillaceae bacterium]